MSGKFASDSVVECSIRLGTKIKELYIRHFDVSSSFDKLYTPEMKKEKNMLIKEISMFLFQSKNQK
jgi:hypothetical protein